MNWEAVGAIGEVVGAVGVVLSLVYLGVQIRQGAAQTSLNTKALRATAFQNLLDHHSNIHLNVSTNPEIRAVLIKARDHAIEDFSESEKMVYGSFMNQQIRSFYNGFHLLEERLITEDQWRTFIASIDRAAGTKAFPGWWSYRGAAYPAEFARIIESNFEEPAA